MPSPRRALSATIFRVVRLRGDPVALMAEAVLGKIGQALSDELGGEIYRRA